MGSREEFKNRYKYTTKEKYTDKNRTVEKAKNNKSRRLSRRGKITLILIALGAGTGVFGGCQIYKATHQEKNATINEVMKHGETLESLGISKETKQRIDDLEKAYENEEMDNIEAIQNLQKSYQLLFDTFKEKCASKFDVDIEDVSLHSDKGDEGTTDEYLKISGEEYRERGIFKNKNTIDENVEKLIKYIGKNQTEVGKITTRNGAKTYSARKLGIENLNKVKEVAAAKINVSENGNISMEYTKKKDLASKDVETGEIKIGDKTMNIKIDDEMEK